MITASWSANVERFANVLTRLALQMLARNACSVLGLLGGDEGHIRALCRSHPAAAAEAAEAVRSIQRRTGHAAANVSARQVGTRHEKSENMSDPQREGSAPGGAPAV